MKQTRTAGVVVIGRNEGPRLERCLKSVMGEAKTVVYVDSGSTDGSVDLAQEIDTEVLVLDTSTPFTAARARNAGFDRLVHRCPDVKYVFFIDGDCEMHGDWLDRACQELDRRDDAAIVCGRLRERFPDKSLFNRLADLEWDVPTGNVEACGGVFVIRARAFEEVGRFNPSIPAGEEPELCWRLRQKNWKIVRLKHEMAWHDLAMHHFSQWWKRGIRLGSAGVDVWCRTGRDRNGPFSGVVRSTWRWGLIWPIATIASCIAGWQLGRLPLALTMLVLGLLVWLIQLARVTLYARHRNLRWTDSIAYGCLILICKWAELFGQMKFAWQKCLGRTTTNIEWRS